MESNHSYFLSAAKDIGAKGSPPSEQERLAFEAYMAGHCWTIEGKWNGTTYVHESENSQFWHPGTMQIRMLWAVWRDRAALANW
jgi:hypothetical protein